MGRSNSRGTGECSGLDRAEQRQGAWACQTHGGSSQVAHSRLTETTAASRSCEVCGDGIRANTDHYKCKRFGCDLMCHKKRECSGISRYDLGRQRSCVTHGADPSQPTPSKTSLTLVGREVKKVRTVQLQEEASEKCAKCKSPVRKNTTPMRCVKCNRVFHKACSGLTRDEARMYVQAARNRWNCSICSAPPSRQTGPCINADSRVERKAEFQAKGQLRILQWNADGIKTKMVELESRLAELDIDVCLIQETKLAKKDNTPKLQDYATLRSDRKSNMHGGGLLMFVHHRIQYRTNTERTDNILEMQATEIRLTCNRWLRIVNCYCPPIRTNPNEQRMEVVSWNSLPHGRDVIVAGDMNAHSSLWDSNSAEDGRGEALEEWLRDKSMVSFNDGSATRINRGTGRKSTPDVTMGHPCWLDRIEWKVQEEMGSDHLPILLTVNCQILGADKKQYRARWRQRGVNWDAFAAEVEEKMEQWREDKETLRTMVNKFNGILITAATKIVGKSKPGPRRKPWMTQEVKEAIKTRNQLGRNVAANREQWIQACQAVTKLSSAAKEKRWIEYIEGIDNCTDPSGIWRVVRNLSGTPEAEAPNEALIVGGKCITSNERKADTFTRHYAAVSRLHFSKIERGVNRSCKRILQKQSVDGECTKEFWKEELEQAIKQMKSKGAAGPDDIPPSFIKALGDKAKNRLLQIFNTSWVTGVTPQTWKNATIIPLLKSGKPPSKVDSYRPVSLTSCVVKTMERMVGNRIAYMAESEGWFTRDQAGFRKQLSCEDQVLRVTQSISDGFQCKPAQRTVLALLDYSKAYDKVWKEELLLSMEKKGIPARVLRWVAGFLSNWQARVCFNGSMARMKPFRQGLPQGAVMSPLLFLFYINSLAEQVPSHTNVALYADDVSLWSSHPDKHTAMVRVQESVAAVAKWSRDKKMTLSKDKSEVAFFTTDAKEAKFKPTVQLEGAVMPFNPTPRFLGVTLDRVLSFGPHTDTVKKKLATRLRVLSAVGSRSWGWRRKTMEMLYKATVKSNIMYAAPAWQPWLAQTNMQKLETFQNKALRTVTGQLQTTPLEAIRAESAMISITTASRRATAVAYEKALRLNMDHPRRRAAVPRALHRSHRSSWRKEATVTLATLPEELQRREDLRTNKEAPWARKEAGLWKTVLSIPGGLSKASPVEELRQAALDAIDAIQASRTIYTDGSAEAGVLKGGAAAVVTSGSPQNIVVEEVIRTKGRPLTSSFEEERQAMLDAIRWIQGNDQLGKVAICSDSQAAISALHSGSPEMEEVRAALNQCRCEVIIQWIPGHADITGNEKADLEAKRAAGLPTGQRVLPISFATAKATINRHISDPVGNHQRTLRVYGGSDGLGTARTEGRSANGPATERPLY